MPPPCTVALALAALLALSTAVRGLQQASAPQPAETVALNATNATMVGASAPNPSAAALTQEINIGDNMASSIAEPGVYYEASDLIGNNVVFAADDCKAQCLANQACRVWSWCPSTQKDGCVVQYGNVGSGACGAKNHNGSRVIQPSTCEFTTDPVGTVGFSLFIYRGPAVPTISGLVTRVLIPPQLPHMLDDSGSSACTEYHSTELNGAMPELDLVLDSADGSSCCEACNNKPGCKVWKVCPSEDSRCQDLAVAGYCLLMNLTSSGEATVAHQGLDTPWVSGYAAA